MITSLYDLLGLDIRRATLPAWNAASVSTGVPLTMEMVLKAAESIRESRYSGPPRFIFPPPVRGNSQRDRRRRTVMDNGIRYVLPEGSIPTLWRLMRASGTPVSQCTAESVMRATGNVVVRVMP